MKISKENIISEINELQLAIDVAKNPKEGEPKMPDEIIQAMEAELNKYKEKLAAIAATENTSKVDTIMPHAPNLCPPMDNNGNRLIDDKSIAKLEACVSELPSTKSAPNFVDGKYSESRQKLHEEIIGDILSKPCIDRGQPLAIIMGGLPGSGKSTYLAANLKWLQPDQYVHIDADDIRAKLPEYKGWNASATHSETKDIVIEITNRLADSCNKDIIYDGTMNKASSYSNIIKILKNKGYKIFVIYIEIDEETAIKRALERYQRTGRWVPLSVIHEAAENGRSAFNDIKKNATGWLLVNGNDMKTKSGGDGLPNDRDYVFLTSGKSVKNITQDVIQKKIENEIKIGQDLNDKIASEGILNETKEKQATKDVLDASVEKTAEVETISVPSLKGVDKVEEKKNTKEDKNAENVDKSVLDCEEYCYWIDDTDPDEEIKNSKGNYERLYNQLRKIIPVFEKYAPNDTDRMARINKIKAEVIKTEYEDANLFEKQDSGMIDLFEITDLWFNSLQTLLHLLGNTRIIVGKKNLLLFGYEQAPNLDIKLLDELSDDDVRLFIKIRLYIVILKRGFKFVYVTPNKSTSEISKKNHRLTFSYIDPIEGTGTIMDSFISSRINKNWLKDNNKTSFYDKSNRETSTNLDINFFCGEHKERIDVMHLFKNSKKRQITAEYNKLIESLPLITDGIAFNPTFLPSDQYIFILISITNLLINHYDKYKKNESFFSKYSADFYDFLLDKELGSFERLYKNTLPQEVYDREKARVDYVRGLDDISEDIEKAIGLLNKDKTVAQTELSSEAAYVHPNRQENTDPVLVTLSNKTEKLLKEMEEDKLVPFYLGQTGINISNKKGVVWVKKTKKETPVVHYAFGQNAKNLKLESNNVEDVLKYLIEQQIVLRKQLDEINTAKDDTQNINTRLEEQPLQFLKEKMQRMKVEELLSTRAKNNRTYYISRIKDLKGNKQFSITDDKKLYTAFGSIEFVLNHVNNPDAKPDAVSTLSPIVPEKKNLTEFKSISETAVDSVLSAFGSLMPPSDIVAEKELAKLVKRPIPNGIKVRDNAKRPVKTVDDLNKYDKAPKGTYATKASSQNITQGMQMLDLDKYSRASVYMIPTKDIELNAALFQSRSSLYSQNTFDKLEAAYQKGYFQLSLFDPILLYWEPETGKLISINHTRLVWFKHAKSKGYSIEYDNETFDFSKIPSIVIDGKKVSLDKIIEIANNSNKTPIPENLFERADYWKERISTSDKNSLADVFNELKEIEGKNATVVRSLAFLSKSGKAIAAYNAAKSGKTEQRNNILVICSILGKIREKHAELQKSHEDELFTWLSNGAFGTGATQVSSFKEINEVITKLIKKNEKDGVFDAKRPLNPQYIKSLTSVDIEYNKKIKEALQNLRTAKDKWLSKAKEVLLKQSDEIKTMDINFNSMMKPEDESIFIAARYLRTLLAERPYIKQYKNQQVSLF